MNFIDALIQLKAGKTIESEYYSLRLTTEGESTSAEVEIDIVGDLHFVSIGDFEIILEMMLADWSIAE